MDTLQPRHNHALQDGLVAHWTFDEGKGSAIRDASGQGHHGSAKNTAWAPGRINQALNFEKGGFVVIPDHEQLRVRKDFTITTWVKKTQASKKGKSMGIVSKFSLDSRDYDLFMSTSKLEHPAFYSDAFQTSGGDIEVISATPMMLNEWHHIAVTRKGSRATIYLDGVISGRAILPEDLTSSSKDLMIGHDHDGGFSGSIDEVRIYNRALEEDEIRAVMKGQVDVVPAFTHIIVDPAVGGIRGIADIDVKDMNRDGCADVLLSHSERAGYPVAWYEAAKSDKGSWTDHLIDTVDFCHTLQPTDMDLDGDIDVVAGEMEKSEDPDQTIIFLNEGDGLRWRKHVIANTGIYSGKVADTGNDGDPDIVGNRNYDKPPMEIWQNLLRNSKSESGRK